MRRELLRCGAGEGSGVGVAPLRCRGGPPGAGMWGWVLRRGMMRRGPTSAAVACICMRTGCMGRLVVGTCVWFPWLHLGLSRGGAVRRREHGSMGTWVRYLWAAVAGVVGWGHGVGNRGEGGDETKGASGGRRGMVATVVTTRRARVGLRDTQPWCAGAPLVGAAAAWL